ncbi:MAG: helix-turn-helix transcriptional regulator [Bradyrhizobium sp.]|nr:helix-turn-helix transcriptional regulator [Bradyrhizobium sp.]
MATSSTYRSEIFRAGVMSALFSLFKSKKKRAAAKGEKYLLQDMAEAAGVTKSQASRWFSFNAVPNWQLSTLYLVCDALGADVDIRIVDRETGEVHSASGVALPSTQVIGTPFVSGTGSITGNTVMIDGSMSYGTQPFPAIGLASPQTPRYVQMAA